MRTHLSNLQLNRVAQHRASSRVGLAVAVLFTALLGCSSVAPALREARDLQAAGQPSAALAVLERGLKDQPKNAELRAAYIQVREAQLNAIVSQAQAAAARGDATLARQRYGQVLVIDANHPVAGAGLLALDREERISEQLAAVQAALERNDDAQAQVLLRQVLLQAPEHPVGRTLMRVLEQRSKADTNPAAQRAAEALKKPVQLDFKDASLKQMFDVLARTAGLNFVFDREVKTDQRVSLSLKDKSVKDAIELILLSSQLEQRQVDATTILIYPSTPAKLKDHQSLTIRSFFLANADPEAVATSLKTLIKTRDVIVDKKQNMLILRDTPEAIRLAERIVALHDLAEPEVMLEVEILEINRNRLTELGVKFPDQLSFTPLPSTSGGTLTVNDLINLNRNTVGVGVNALSINARGQDTDVRLLANPRIRAKNRETAKILIGDKVPNITSTSTSTGFVSESVQYLDVGLKLDVTPVISVDNEVSIKIALEVSNIAAQVKTSAGTLAYQIGTRTASTVLRLRDGENQVLAGLINDEDRRTANQIPGLGRIPVAGRLFGSQLDESRKTEIVLSITPRLVRNLSRPDASLLEFDSGTESSARGLGAGPSAAPVVVGGAPSPPPAATSSSAPAASAAGTNPATAPAAAGLAGGGYAPNSPSPNLPPPGTATGLRWQAPAQVKAGEAFTVQLLAAASQPVYGLSYAIGFDPAVIEVVNVAEGSFLKQGGADSVFSPRVDRSTGQVFVTNQRTGSTPPTGTGATGSLLVLTLRARPTNAPTQLQLVNFNAQGREGVSVGMQVPTPASITVAP
ncbi:general secretion pathway protein GspD [beta proteobacterium AAP99]|nr:general secretion pathway protein GspD [beta proteobacterium AAP99]